MSEMTRPVLDFADTLYPGLRNKTVAACSPEESIVAGIAWTADNAEYGIDEAARNLIDEFRAFVASRQCGPNDRSLFRERSPEAAARQCAMMFAQATEWLLEIHSDAWKHLPLYIKNPLSAHVATLVYHCRDLSVRPEGLGGKALPKLKNGLDHPGLYGEVEVVRLDATNEGPK